MTRKNIFLQTVVLGAALFAGCGGEVGDNATTDEGTVDEASVLPMKQVMIDAKNAGLPCSHLVMAGAIADAESSLNPNAVGSNGPTPGCSHGSKDLGLWQINNCYHPLRCNAFDPGCNARAMASISGNGGNWGPWSTYHNGAYKRFLATAQAAYKGVPGCH